MNHRDAEAIVTAYVKPIFGFALRRCRRREDAEDLSQEIVLRAFRTFLAREDIADPARYIWTIAHNALSNYYRDTARMAAGIPLDALEEILSSPEESIEDVEATLRHLRREIAYLSETQRRVVIGYYFAHRRQTELAAELGIPVGTVKWHLFEAKKELKRGMSRMRNESELSFHPIRFTGFSLNGTGGSKSSEDIFHSALSQNIAYTVRSEAKSVNEIAETLGVSPVYVESEAAYLEEYGFLLRKKRGYIANFIIDVPTTERIWAQSTMYRQAAQLYAEALHEELCASGILDSGDIWCSQTDGVLTMTAGTVRDINYLLWALIPYITANTGAGECEIAFDEVATVRPDGGHNIIHALVMPEKEMAYPPDYVPMDHWCGPMWNSIRVEGDAPNLHWQYDSPWSERDMLSGSLYRDEVTRVLSMYAREWEGERLTQEEYAWLTEREYVKTCGEYDGYFKSAWQVVVLSNRRIQAQLLAIGERVKTRYWQELEALKEPYAQQVLESLPSHLRRVQAYELQYTFHADGCFLCYCLTHLVNTGKLQEPTEGQRKSLGTVLAFA